MVNLHDVLVLFKLLNHLGHPSLVLFRRQLDQLGRSLLHPIVYSSRPPSAPTPGLVHEPNQRRNITGDENDRVRELYVFGSVLD